MADPMGVVTFLGLGDLVQKSGQANFGVVALGGFFGGLLQPVVAKLNPRANDPTTVNFLLSPLLGIAAAGISVYVVAGSDTKETLRLLFFALLCGMAFPAVLASAVDNVAKRTTNVQQELTQIADKARSDGIAETAQAAQDLKTTMVKNPPESIDAAGQKVCANAAQQAVINIAQTAANDPDSARQVIEELKEVGAVARTAGWVQTAQDAADELRKLGALIVDEGDKATAERGADRISNASG